jgi:hypothetical protein
MLQALIGRPERERLSGCLALTQSGSRNPLRPWPRTTLEDTEAIMNGHSLDHCVISELFLSRVSHLELSDQIRCMARIAKRRGLNINVHHLRSS